MSELVEFVNEVGGFYFRSVFLPNAGTWIDQHVHDHDHATYCGAGAAVLYVNGEPKERVEAGHAVAIKAGQKHAFWSVEPNTRLTCVHDVKSAESVKAKGI